MPTVRRSLVALICSLVLLPATRSALAADPLTRAALGDGTTLVIRPKVAGLEVSFLPNPDLPRKWTLSLKAPAGASSAEVDVTFPPARVAPLVVILPRPTRAVLDGDLRLHLESDGGIDLIGVVRPWLEAPRMKVFGDVAVYAGTRYAPRVVAVVPEAGCREGVCERALEGAEIVAELASGKDRERKVLATAKATTDASGSAPLSIAVPDGAAGDLELRVTMSHVDGNAAASQPLKVVAASQILLSTDKPIYQPGQTLHLRLLARDRGTGRAAGKAATTLAVFDAKNNKVFQKKGVTSAEGVFAARLDIASLVNTGRWRISANVGDDEVEKTVDVKPYVLPKFKVEVKPERDAYKPGERVKGSVTARYFFGEPLRKAKVELVVETFDVATREIARVSLVLDDAGAQRFDFALPEMLAGQPLMQGAAAVMLTAHVSDTAGQTHEGRKSLAVYKDALKVFAMPEAGRLVPGVDNAVFFVVTTPDGAPAPRAQVVLDGSVGTAPATMETDHNGIAEWHVTPAGALSLDVVVKTPDGVQARHRVALDTAPARQAQVLLRPSNLAPRAGEAIDFDVLVQGAIPHVFVDLVRDGQTLVTLSGPVREGRARIATTLPIEAAGTVLAHAYAIGKDMDVYADTRPLVVRQANGLAIEVVQDKLGGHFAPGEEASLAIKVTDGQGHPVLAALGLWAVDEAVFALSELRPGMEQVFFLLEQEIMRPKVEIHAFEPDEVFFPGPGPAGPAPEPRLAAAAAAGRPARVLAAAAMPSFAHASAVDSRREEEATSQALWVELFNRKAERMARAMRELVRTEWRMPSGREVHRAMKKAGIDPDKTRDWFGVPFQVTVAETTERVSQAALVSAGPDATWNTADDMSQSLGLEDALAPVWEMESRREEMRWRRGGVVRFGLGKAGAADAEVMVMADRPVMAREMLVLEGAGGGGGGDAPAGGRMVIRGTRTRSTTVGSEGPDRDTDGVVDGDDKQTGAGGGDAPRIRSYFPETLYVNPLVVTDANGVARVTFPMADSITTWRLSALASAQDGRFGSTATGLKVFQDFFVDIAFPASLTRKDEVTVPVAVYNYLPEAQTVELTLGAEGGLATRGDTKLTVKLGPNEVKGVQVPLVATRVGMGRLTVMAKGSRLSDAVRREVKIEADGFPVERSESGMLSDALELAIEVPEGAIEAASTALLKLYPGMFAQVVDGLENMLRMPSGCFEQTSSATFPNILVLRYLRDSKKSKPELEATALTYLQAGWQRLVTYEVPGGGFSWFGDAPANKVLTAYGLMEFEDMDKVYEIDRKVIERTRAWIVRQQNGDGSFSPDKSHLHEESWGDMQKSSLIVSAYITWALAHTRPDRKQLDAPLSRGLDYLEKHLDEADDAYVLGYIANAFAEATADRGGERGRLRKALAKLAKLAVADGDELYFPTKLRTAMYGSGESATIEVTALALRAFMRGGEHLDLVKPGLNWLVKRKDQLGNWSTTQATIQVLQAMIASLSAAAEPVSGSIEVAVNGEVLTTASYSKDDFDVVRFIDASPKLRAGKNTIRITPSPGMKPMFQLATTSYLPWGDSRQPAQQAFDVKVTYDRTTMDKDDIVGVRVEVRSNLAGVASMGIVDVAVPPGFEVLPEDLERAVADKTLQRFTLAGRQIILYVPEFKPDQPFVVSYRVRARFPLRAASGSATVYEYYNPDNRGMVGPAAIVVD